MPTRIGTKDTGKGGDFTKRRNPFASKGTSTSKPNLAGVPSLGAVLDAVLLGGAAIMLGATRDGGAVVVTVFDGEDRHRTYCSNDHELESAFASIFAAYE